MSDLKPMLTPKQRGQLDRIWEAFRSMMEQRDPILEAKEILMPDSARHQTVIDTLRSMPPEVLGAAVEFIPDPRSGYKDGSELLADIRDLQEEGVL